MQDLIQSIKVSLKEYMATRCEVVACYLFGSLIKGTLTSVSDIDIAILLTNDVLPHNYMDLRLSYFVDLSDKYDRELDVVILNEAGPLLRFEVFSCYTPILIKDISIASEFIARSFVEYCDFLPIKHRVESSIFASAGI